MKRKYGVVDRGRKCLKTFVPSIRSIRIFLLKTSQKRGSRVKRGNPFIYEVAITFFLKTYWSK